MKMLLHTYYTSCSIICIETLRSEAIESVGFQFNPNIHPYTEYRSRKGALVQHVKDMEMELILEDNHDLREFIRNVSPDFNHRCGYCCSVRTKAATVYAAEHGFDGFISTLPVSPYQNYELLRETMGQSARKYGMEFLYRDFRSYFREGQEKAREKGLYIQKHYGCAFSEEDRYRKKPKKRKETMQAL